MNLCNQSEAFYYVDQNVDGKVFRVFTYRLASYTDFCKPNALECRGHTFLMNGYIPTELVSMPPAKFFNAYENPMVMDLDFSQAVLYMDKVDGSLISTVKDHTMPHGFRFKSKTSFTSQQAIDAYNWILRPENERFLTLIRNNVYAGYTVNFEWTGPSNRIVIGYKEHSLCILNIRDNRNGQTYYPDECEIRLQEYVVAYDTVRRTYEEILEMTGIEGFVVVFRDGRVCKVKTTSYCIAHRMKDSVNNPKALFQACLFETSDDLRSMFHDDELALSQISSMEALVRREYNHRSALLQKFYDDNKSLIRKDFAIKGQKELGDMFSLGMNLYLGKDIGLKEWMMKNYRAFGINEIHNEDE